MFADIKRIFEEGISNRVNQIDVILEAITNTVHANVTLKYENNFNENLLNFE